MTDCRCVTNCPNCRSGRSRRPSFARRYGTHPGCSNRGRGRVRSMTDYYFPRSRPLYCRTSRRPDYPRLLRLSRLCEFSVGHSPGSVSLAGRAPPQSSIRDCSSDRYRLAEARQWPVDRLAQFVGPRLREAELELQSGSVFPKRVHPIESFGLGSMTLPGHARPQGRRTD